MTSSDEFAPSLQDVAKQYWPGLNLRTLYRKLKVVTQDYKDYFEGYINQKLAGKDLVEIHDRIRRTASDLQMAKKRPFEHFVDRGIDAVADVAESFRKSRSDPDLLKEFKNDKYMFAKILSQRAQRALVEQSICKKWQLQCKDYPQLQHAMQAALLHTFTDIQQAHVGVPLFRAQPKWIIEREKKVWRLEVDVGKAAVEVGPVSDRSLIELDPIDTGLKLPES